MKKEAIFVLTMVVLLGASASVSAYSGGDGSAENPYRIATPNDLNDIGNHVEDFNKCFVMVNDVNLACYTGTEFNIIGNSGTPFTGVYDGAGHTISNFTYECTDTDYIGLFGYIDDPNAEIRGLTLIDPNVAGGSSDYVGSLAGYLGDGTISGCSAEGGSVLGYNRIGGLVGYNQYGTISNCYATVAVSGEDEVGGLLGYNHSMISDCYATGNVSGDDYIGGLVGDNWVTISNCYATGNVSGDDQISGLVGINHGTISNCYATGSASGDINIGGLVGDSYEGTISNCYATGSASGSSYTGGLAGRNYATVSASYATGSASGDINIGGLVGRNYATVLASFWDTETSGQLNGVGGGSSSGVTGKTTAEMMTKSTFTDAGWDFVEVWNIHENVTYPYLRWTVAYSGGDGSTEDPYLIATAEDMNSIGANSDDWDAHFLLVADIDLAGYTGTQFNIIGNFGTPFTGVFDGNDHTISNFTYATIDTEYIGLFGYIDDPDAEIRDLTLIDPNVNAAGDSWECGSLVGIMDNGTIVACGAEGGSVSAGHNRIGGLVGYNEGTISNCYATASVSGEDEVGGLAGCNRGTISNCYATGSVSGSSFIGGLVGCNEGTISNCHATGSVSGSSATGGLVGINSELPGAFYGTISNCYAAGSVSGSSSTGGLVGYNITTVSASFWDTETSGQASSDGGTGKTTAEMKSEGTFTNAGWDFVEIWNIGENQTYPYLRVYPAGDLNHDGRVDFFDFAIAASHWLEGAGQ